MCDKVEYMGKLNKILIAIIIVGVLISGAIILVKTSKSPSEKFLSPQEAAERAIAYINQNLLQKGISASLINVREENGIYKFHLKLGENEFDSYVTRDGNILFIEGIDLEKPATVQSEPREGTTTIGNFNLSQDEVCKEDEKPIVYFFGSERCPHCKWEHPIIETVASKFKENIAFHNNMDSNVDTEVFSKYSPGSIPTLVLGCKYYRVGSGEQLGEKEESKVLTALICKLTENQPAEICKEVQDLINQVK